MPEQERQAGMEIEDIDEGDKVQWNYGAKGHPSGVVSEIVPDKLTITSKGKQISKNGDEENPAVHVERQGNDVVKRAAELHVLTKGDGEAPEMAEGKEKGVVGQEGKDELSKKSKQEKEANENGKAEELDAQQEEGTKNKSEDEEDKDTDMKEAGEEKTNEEQHKDNGKGGEEVNEVVELHQEANPHAERPGSVAQQNAKTKKKQDEDEEKDKGQENGENGKKRKAEDAAEDTVDEEGGEVKKAKTEDGQIPNGKPRGRGRPAKGDKPETTTTTKKKEPTAPTRRSTRNKS